MDGVVAVGDVLVGDVVIVGLVDGVEAVGDVLVGDVVIVGLVDGVEAVGDVLVGGGVIGLVDGVEAVGDVLVGDVVIVGLVDGVEAVGDVLFGGVIVGLVDGGVVLVTDGAERGGDETVGIDRVVGGAVLVTDGIDRLIDGAERLIEGADRPIGGAERLIEGERLPPDEGPEPYLWAKVEVTTPNDRIIRHRGVPIENNLRVVMSCSSPSGYFGSGATESGGFEDRSTTDLVAAINGSLTLLW